MAPDHYHFQGFDSPNYTQVPDQLFDVLMPLLSGAELKVLLYIMRRTFGFKKDSDSISFSQITAGIRTADGRQLDSGTGLSKSTAISAINGLEEKNVIKRVRSKKANGDHATTNYALNLRNGQVQKSNPPAEGLSENTTTPQSGNRTTLVRKSDKQETVPQDTENVERLRSNALKTSDQDLEPDAGFADGSIPSVDQLSPAAQVAYNAYKQSVETGRIPALDSITPPRKAPAAAQGLDEQEIGFGLGLADEIAETLGSARQNAGYYRTLAFDAVKNKYLPLVRQCLSETKAGDVPHGTVKSRPAYFTRILQSKAKAQGLRLPTGKQTRHR